MSRTFDAGERGVLESERDFLLRSLDDLEAERAAGELDADRYRELKDEYTARAAAVLRALEAGAAAPATGTAGEEEPAAPPAPARRRRTALVATAVVAFVAVAAGALGASLGERGEGQTATGNDQSAAGGAEASAEAARRQRDAAARAVEERPDDAAARLAYAQALLDTGDVAEAVRQFDTAARLDPGNAEALAYGGWVVFLAARADPSRPEAAELTEGALRRLDAAVAARPDYPDAHFFRGMILLRGRDDPAGAAAEFERYLALAPDGPMSDEVRALLEAARSQTGG